MIYCVDLKIPVDPLKDYSILNQTGSEPEIYFAEPGQVNEEFTFWLEQNNFVMTYPPLIFYTPKGQQCGIHIDGFDVSDRACINFIVGGSGSLMHWYKRKDNCGVTTQVETQAGTPYTIYDPDQVEHVYSHAVKWPSIVQTGVPHNIHNHHKENRWCISCDISFKDNPKSGLTMEQAIGAFKQWIL
jgi:hypothetical protein